VAEVYCLADGIALDEDGVAAQHGVLRGYLSNVAFLSTQASLTYALPRGLETLQ
jgi:hypothetical protein